MKSITRLGLGLSIIFGSLLLALVAELYYLLWWKKKKNNTILTTNTHQIQNPQKRSNFAHILNFCKRPSSSFMRSTALVHDPQSSNPNNKDLWLKKPFAEENMGNFPRFLFTITEETREDLESEDGVFKNRNLSDLLQILETPFLTPTASPPYFTPPLTPSFGGSFSPFWELEGDAEFNRRRASPPPVFKFLREADEKMVRRRREEGGEEREDGENGKFIVMVVDEKDEGEEGDDNGERFSSSRCSSHR